MAGLLRQAERAARAHGAVRVRALRVRLGALSHLSPAHFREHLDEVAPGTVLEGARVEAVVCEDQTAPYALGLLLEQLELEVPDEGDGPATDPGAPG